jgi:8-oxo-dGTP pyrophosphatase MutT (NUDIX family)
MYKTIYFNQKPLFLCDEVPKELEDYLHREDAVFIDDLDSHSVKAMIFEMGLTKVNAGLFLHPDMDALLKAFKKKFTVLLAGGGLVHTPDHSVLMIFRRGKWDLPKGKLDKGETMEKCAVREVKEETGIKEISIERPLTVTYHTYHQDGKHILKESHWYLMQAASKEDLQPQEEEDIEKCEWVPIEELEPYMGHTHPSIHDVISKGLQELKSARQA